MDPEDTLDIWGEAVPDLPSIFVRRNDLHVVRITAEHLSDLLGSVVVAFGKQAIQDWLSKN